MHSNTLIQSSTMMRSSLEIWLVIILGFLGFVQQGGATELKQVENLPLVLTNVITHSGPFIAVKSESSRIYLSVDYGKNFVCIDSQLVSDTCYSRVPHDFAFSRDQKYLYVVASKGYVHQYNITLKQWMVFRPGGDASVIEKIVYCDNGSIYISAEKYDYTYNNNIVPSGIFESKDQGLTWKQLPKYRSTEGLYAGVTQLIGGKNLIVLARSSGVYGGLYSLDSKGEWKAHSRTEWNGAVRSDSYLYCWMNERIITFRIDGDTILPDQVFSDIYLNCTDYRILRGIHQYGDVVEFIVARNITNQKMERVTVSEGRIVDTTIFLPFYRYPAPVVYVLNDASKKPVVLTSRYGDSQVKYEDALTGILYNPDASRVKFSENIPFAEKII